MYFLFKFGDIPASYVSLPESRRPLKFSYWCFPKMGVSKNRGTHGYPQIIHFNRVFHYKPSILGYHYFWKHPNRVFFLQRNIVDANFEQPFVQGLLLAGLVNMVPATCGPKIAMLTLILNLAHSFTLYVPYP